MKTITIVILAVILACNIEVDAGSFNLSISFNPGISFSRNYRLRHREKNYVDENDDDDDVDWPQPDHINQFEKPGLLPNPEDNTVSDENEFLHHGSRHRPRQH